LFPPRVGPLALTQVEMVTVASPIALKSVSRDGGRGNEEAGVSAFRFPTVGAEYNLRPSFGKIRASASSTTKKTFRADSGRV
jgi:hypothetical protein